MYSLLVPARCLIPTRRLDHFDALESSRPLINFARISELDLERTSERNDHLESHLSHSHSTLISTDTDSSLISNDCFTKDKADVSKRSDIVIDRLTEKASTTIPRRRFGRRRNRLEDERLIVRPYQPDRPLGRKKTPQSLRTNEYLTQYGGEEFESLRSDT